MYRFWRDLGCALSAVIAELLAQALGLSAAVIAGDALTFASGLLAARRITDGSLPDGTPQLSPHGGQAPQPFRRRHVL